MRTFVSPPSLLLAFLLVALPGCGASVPNAGAPPIAGSLDESRISPDVAQKGNGSSWVYFLPKTTATGLYTYDGLVVGPDHNVWFQDMQGNAIVRMTETGAIKEFPVAFSTNSAGGGMAVGSDHRFYLGAFDTTNSIGYVDAIDKLGNATSYEIGTNSTNTESPAGGVALGPDGNIWFTEYHHIGMITPAGAISQYAYPNSSQYASPGDIVKGRDHNMWFTLGGAGINPAWLGKIVPSTGVMTFYNLTSLVGCSFDNALTSANDGNVWVDCGTEIVRVTPAGTATAFTTPSSAYGGEVSGDMTPGAGQTIWYGGAGTSGNLVQYDIASHTFTAHVPPFGTITNPRSTIVGPDGNVWFAGVHPGAGGSRMEIAVDVLNPIKVTPTSLSISLTSPGTLTVAENGVVSWTARSSNAAIATVAQGSSMNQFVVTGHAAGTCSVTIADRSNNSVAIKVTVQANAALRE